MSKREDEELQHLLRRLVHIVVGSEENVEEPVLGFFVEQALLEVGNHQSQRKIIQGIKTVFRLEFKPEEIGFVLKKFVDKGTVISTPDGRYSLEVKRAEELQKQNTQTAAFEEKIYADWSKAISAKYTELSAEDKLTLVSDLRLYLNKVFLRHGAECAILIYPEHTKLDALLRSSSVETFETELPNRSETILGIRRVEFPLFLKELDGQKKVHFAQILDGTYIYSIVQVDPLTQKFVSETFKQYKTYLDTNVLFAIFGLQDQQRATTVENTIALAKTLGIKVAVTQYTVEEMKRTITSKKQGLLDSAPIRRELTEIAADVSDEENFITAYWRAYYRTGITKEDYIEKVSHITEMLQYKGIKIDKMRDFPQTVIDNEVKKLNEAIKPNRKGRSVARHDAYHKLLIEHWRGNSEMQQTAQKFWFLSLDGLLLIYSAKARPEGEPPFVMLVDQLLQLLRRFGSRTEDYDAAFFDAFSRPQIKSAQGVLPINLTQKLLAKMSGYADLPPETARSILLDQTFRKGVVEATTDTDLYKVIDEKIESVFAKELKTSQERLEALRLEKEKSDREIESTGRRMASKDHQIVFYRNLAFAISIIFYLFINAFLLHCFWVGASQWWRAVGLLIDVVLLYYAIRIRWQVGTSWAIVLGVTGVVAFILQAIVFS